MRSFDGIRFGWFRSILIEVIRNDYWNDSLWIESEKREFAYNLCSQLEALDSNNLSMDARNNALEAIINSNRKAVPILERVFEVLNHRMHIKLGSPLRFDHCLAFILYTSTPANYDLTKTQLAHNTQKWKYFDHCLSEGIARLGYRQQIRNCDLWCGLNCVYFDTSMAESDAIFLSSHQSSSIRKSVAENFRTEWGTIVKIDSNSLFPFFRCDVSWISMYESECEVLLARGALFKMKEFNVVIEHKQFIQLEGI